MQRGEIYWCEYEYEFEGTHHQQKRPAILVSNDTINITGESVEVVFLTTKGKDSKLHPTITSAREISRAKCEEVTTVDRDKIGFYIGTCSDAEMMKVELAIMESLALDSMLTDPEWPVKTETTQEYSPEQNQDAAINELNQKLYDLKEELASTRKEAEIYRNLYSQLLDRAMQK